ncbi:MAG: hypothetical protein HYY84_18130 [Deltaproteobacteria bacterium]|nr:hypothetical protein [Deltaproteobacteria bacterium]
MLNLSWSLSLVSVFTPVLALAQVESPFSRSVPTWVELSAEMSRGDLARLARYPNVRVVIEAPKNQLSERMVDAINSAKLAVNVAVNASVTGEDIGQLRKLHRLEVTVRVKAGEMSEELAGLLETVGPIMKHVVFVGAPSVDELRMLRKVRYFGVAIESAPPSDITPDIVGALARLRLATRTFVIDESWTAGHLAQLKRLRNLRLFVVVKGNYLADETLAALNSIRTIGTAIRLTGRLESHQLDQLAKVRHFEAHIAARGAVLSDEFWDALSRLSPSVPAGEKKALLAPGL